MDGKAQVIVGQHVRPQATDLQEVGRGLDEVEASTDRLPEKMTWDNGYYSGPNLQEVSEREVQAYIATEKGEKKAKAGLEESDRWWVKADFVYDEQEDGFHCPGGQMLRFKRTPGRGRREYRGEIQVCQSCRYYRRCCRSQSCAARTIWSDGQEPVFGQIKNSGFRGFGVRGKERVAGEFSLVCVAPNFKKIMLAALRGEVCPEFGKRVALA